MEYDINPLVRLKVYIVNGNSELVMKGMEKLIIVFNKREITNYSQFIDKLNEIFEDYGKVEKITDKEGFKIMELNNLPINNIWDYLSNDNIVHVSLTDKKNKEINNKNNRRNESVSFNYSSRKSKNEDNIKSEKNKKNNFSKTSKNKNLIHFSSSSSSNRNNNKKRYTLSSSSSSSSSSLSNENNNKNRNDLSSSSSSSSLKLNSPKKKVTYQNHQLEKEKKKYFSSSSSSSSSIKKNNKNKKNNEVSPIKNDKNNNSLNIKNNRENYKLLGKKRKNENNYINDLTFQEKNNFNKNRKKPRRKNRYNSYNNINGKNNKNSSIENKNINYELIPSEKLDDITFLQNSYPKLFNKGTNIKFKAQELLPNGIGVGDYHYGVIEDFNLEIKSFLIKKCNSMNEKSLLLMYSYEEDLMCINLKNFVEIWIESENKTSELSKVVNSSNYNVDIDEDLKKKFIKRQIEYYFSDDNFEKDTFLKSKEDENGYIPIDVIMSFNKIKMITTDKDLFVKALKENENNIVEGKQNKLYELNEDLTKIRKVNFMNFMAL